ncbi:hypothetical protein FSP39_024947 [Pinctada imbricata]|uniref:Uncharacterized protein n=1 Tax=Pinctada imbricata TaxID=66713 RepID=A0AA89C3V9_PINIB|nr:hypothetical protein FSP39_024947 [Pinctada imbricata]
MDACLNTMETDSSPNFSFRNSDPYYQSGAVPFVNTNKVEAENQRRPCLPYISYQNIDPPPPTCKTSETLWKYPEYVYLKERLASFKDWPQYLKGPSKKDLAGAGFVYTKIGDKVTCFWCGMTFKNWEPFDDAYMEHLKWSKDCMYAKIVSNDN